MGKNTCRYIWGKRLLTYAFMLVFADSALVGQHACEPTWVFFSDKTETDTPAEVLPHTLSRRQLRGSQNAEELAKPVSANYLRNLRALNYEIRSVSKWLNAASVCADRQDIVALSALPFVSHVRPVARLTSHLEEHIPEDRSPLETHFLKATDKIVTDTLYGVSRKQLESVNAIEPLKKGFNGEGVRIGFIDTRFDFTQPALQHIEAEGRLLGAESFIPDSVYTNYHGLNVSSVAVGYDKGNLIGPCWGGDVLVATTEVTQFEHNAEEDYFVAGMEWLEEQGADIVSVSLGYDLFDDGQHSYAIEDLDGNTMVTSVAADAAVALGVTVVAAAGNSGACGAHSQSCWYYVGSPAEGDSVIAVGGINPDSTRWGSSSAGPTYDRRTKPDVMAQSSSVYFANSIGTYSAGSGTSFAAPMVSGVICQVLQANPELKPRDVWSILTETASHNSEPDSLYGWGIVNADAAVDRALGLLALAGEDLPGSESVANLEIFPNPASDIVTIQFSADAPGHTPEVLLTDVAGRLVGRTHATANGAGVSSSRLPVSGLAPGVYFVSVIHEKERATQKLIVYR